MTRHFDLAVIGAGSGNMVVNRQFSHLSVAQLESGRFGGTCLNVGCIPTKMLVHPADVVREARGADRLGVDLHLDGVRWTDLRDRIFARTDEDAEEAEEYRRALANHTVYDGRCRFVGDHEIDTGTGEVITADRIVIAAGSRVVLPDLPGLDEVPHHTSDTVMRIDALPRRMLIVGGGFVAAEFAHLFSAYGVEVTQVHRGPRLLRSEDQEIAARFTELAGRQWDLRLDTRVDRLRRTGDTIVAELDGGATVETDLLLLGTGRTSNADLLAVAATGVQTDEDDVIVVDAFQRTTAEGIFALGDIANHHRLKHVANHEARVVRHNLLHPDAMRAADHRFVPSAVFSSPQIASVGLTEQQAEEAGTPYVVATQDYAGVAFGWAMADTEHFVKLLADPATGHLLGAHLIGPQASTLVQPLVQAMSLGQTVPDLAHGQYWIHPALTEVVENCLLHVERRLDTTIRRTL